MAEQKECYKNIITLKNEKEILLYTENSLVDKVFIALEISKDKKCALRIEGFISKALISIKLILIFNTNIADIVSTLIKPES